MKIYYVFFVLYFCVAIKCQDNKDSLKSEWINQYLHAKSDFVHEKLDDEDQFFLQNRTDEIEMVYNKTCDTETSNSTNAKIFSIFNSTYFLIEDKIFQGVLNETSFRVEQISTLFYTGNISFLKSIEFHNLGFVLLGLNTGTLAVYKTSLDKKSFVSVQNISTSHAKDARFFINNRTLYLITVANQGDNSISIFKWLSTYFDETETIFRRGAKKVTSFPRKTSEIIFVTNSFSNKAEYLSVFSFYQNKIMKIHQIEIGKSSHIDTFLYKNSQHIVIFKQDKNNSVYVWEEFGLVYKNTFRTNFVVNNSVVVYSQRTPLIVTSTLKSIMVHKPKSHGTGAMSTKEYLTNYSVILDINKGGNENGNITFIVGLNEDNIVNINAMSFKVHPEIDNETENDVLKKCFYKLEENIYSEKRKLNVTKDSLSQTKNEQIQSNVFKRQEHDLDALALEDEEEISDFLNSMQERLNKIKPLTSTHNETQNVIVIDNNVLIKGPVNAQKLKTTNLHIKNINGKNWVPEQWLRYEESQTITGPVHLKDVTIKNLGVPPHIDVFFKDFLLKNGNQVISGEVIVNNFTAVNLLTKKINDINIENVYSKNTSPGLLKGLKSFNSVEVEELQIETLNGNKPDDILALFTDLISSNFDFESEVIIKNLWASSIDNINWNDFENSAFQIGQKDPVNGLLTFSALKCDKLHTSSLNGVNINDFLTTTTEQVVDSNVRFNKVFANYVNANKINNISLQTSAVLLHEDSKITGPIRINNLTVLNDLILTGDVDESLMLINNGRIFGTNESDMLQIYNGKVLIKGDLYLTNVTLSPVLNLNVSGDKFNLDQYWRKSTVQKIPVHFEALDGMSVSHINTMQVNSIDVDTYLVNNKEPSGKTAYHFENVTVLGNVILNKSEVHTPDLDKINRDSVKINGVFEINGKKVFNNTLKIHNFSTEVLNGVNVSSIVTKNSSFVNGTKYFKNIVVKENVLATNLSVQNINKIGLDELARMVVYKDRSQFIKNLNFKNVSVTNLNVITINGYAFNEYVENMKKMYSGIPYSKVTITGNVTLENVEKVQKINGIKIGPLIDRVSRKNAIGPRLRDEIRFLGKVKINNLITKRINGIYLPKLTKRLLYKTSNQTISVPYTFKNLKTKNMFVNKINDVITSHLVDVSSDVPQHIIAPLGITIASAKFLKSVKANKILPCNIMEAVNNFQNPPTQMWNKIEIQGNTVFLNEESDIYRILEKTVRNNSKNTVLSPVKFTNTILGENVITSKHINNINLEEILQDALVTDSSEEQVVTGHKNFQEIEAQYVRALENSDVPVVNRIDIPKLYDVIISKNQVKDNVFIKGKKTFFAGLQTRNFYSNMVSNVIPANIVTLTNLSKIPLAIFDSLDIENDLSVKKVNNFDFKEILNNRLLTNGPKMQITNATYFFEDLEIKNNMETISINKINISDVVFDFGTQTIKSQKKFSENLEFFGNTQISYLNTVNITSAYEDVIFKEEKSFINASVKISRPAQLEGNITTRSINGYPIENIKEILEKGTTKAEEKTIFTIKKQIENIIHQTVPLVEKVQNEYMYIEKSEILQISVLNAIDAKVLESKNYVLMHIFGEESAEICGLPETCKCPIQYTIEITPGNSVAPYVNKGQQRIYTYDNEDITIYFSTNSISTDEYCRTDRTKVFNELSSITWTLKKPSNNSFNFHPKFITGYISDVEFFTVNGNTYVIIGRYYDPVSDSHNLDCTIMKFSNDKTKLNDIQRIETKGVKILHLLHTAQGVTLIIGNKGSSYETSNTEIYRFNEETEEFKILRSVPYVCSDVAGVVLGFESLIILAYKNEPIQILKYNSYFDNYYYYQSFELDNPVIGISVFYTGGFGISDAYLCVVTGNEYFYIYTFQFIDGWKLESQGSLEGLRNLIPFELNKELYLFTPSSKVSSLLTVIKHGST